MFLALKDLAFAKGRFALMATVITLVAALIVILSGMVSGLVDQNISGIKAIKATHVAFELDRVPSYTNSFVDREMWTAFEKAPGVTAATPLGNAIFNARVLKKETAITLTLWGIVPGTFMEPEVTSGDAFNSDPRGVIVSQDLIEKGLAIGDVIKLERVLTELKVIGTAPSRNLGHVPIVYAPMDLWQEATYGPPGGPAPGDELPRALRDYASVIMVQLAPGADMAAIAKLDDETGTVTLSRTESYNAAPAYQEEVTSVSAIKFFMIFVAALLVGAFFAVWTIQRTQEIGLVKALGATTGWLIRDALSQALVLMAGSIAVGVAIGLAAGAWISTTRASFDLVPEDVARSMIYLLVAGMIGAAASIRGIAKVDPIIALGAER
jgi:putative ABC transport system permease protein